MLAPCTAWLGATMSLVTRSAKGSGSMVNGAARTLLASFGCSSTSPLPSATTIRKASPRRRSGAWIEAVVPAWNSPGASAPGLAISPTRASSLPRVASSER
ncbi:MAG: hypothetical protein AW07_04184 [Candidatus Accumulibacter sp. SK-11]|nr:MAG: hypothetical protein AW07_04184 [Candidatus Accumulibacter sp. SK-11]